MNNRESNIELVRVVAMSLILLLHFMSHAITRRFMPHGLYQTLYPFLSIGVNLFFLITGWFQVRFSLRSIAKLILIIFIYDIINALLCLAVGVDITPHDWKEFFLWPVSRSTYWFIKVYLGVLITAPLLNAGLRELPLRQLRVFTALFSAFTCYSCAIGWNDCNITGYSYMQAIYLYCLAFYLRHDDILYRHIPQWGCILLYLLPLAACALWYRTDLHAIHYINYNSLPVVLASVALFIFFTRLHFRSRVVNALGSASLGCYLLQDGLFGDRFLYGYLQDCYRHLPTRQWILIFAATFLAIWLAALIIDKALKRVSGKPREVASLRKR